MIKIRSDTPSETVKCLLVSDYKNMFQTDRQADTHY